MSAILVGGLTAAGFYGIFRIIRSGRSAPPLKNLIPRFVIAFLEVGIQKPIFRTRTILSAFHAFIFFGFSFYFLLIHVGSRFIGQALRLAIHGRPDPNLPFASLAANLFGGLSDGALNAGIRVIWWLAVGLIVIFFPYFVRGEHIHLAFAPINLALGKQTPLGPASRPRPGGTVGRPATARAPCILPPASCILHLERS